MSINLTPNQNNLTDEERSTLWSRVRLSITGSRIATNQIIKPKYMNFLTSPMRKGALVLLAIAVLAGTAGAADAAKPGDMLFKLDLSLEKMRLTFADADSKVDLRIKFAEERVDELEEILAEDESATPDPASGTAGDTPGDADTPSTPVETTNADIALAQSIEHLELARMAIEENGGSEIALAALSVVIDKLNARIGTLPEGTELKVVIKNDGDEAEIRIRLKREDGRKDDDENDSDEHENEIKIDNETRIGLKDDEKIEVHVEGGVAKVEAEIEDIHDKFQLETTVRPEIIAQIAERLGMDEDAVEAILKLEIKDEDEDKDMDPSHNDDDEDDDTDSSRDDESDSDDADDDKDKDNKANNSDDDDSDDADDDHDLRIEAKIEDSGVAEIKVKFEGTKDEFKASANTRNDVIDMLLARYDFTEDEINAALDLEIKD